VNPDSISFPLSSQGTQNTFDSPDELKFLRDPEWTNGSIPENFLPALKQQTADVLNQGAELYSLDKELRHAEVKYQKTPSSAHKS
jgi:hypothetical protein